MVRGHVIYNHKIQVLGSNPWNCFPGHSGLCAWIWTGGVATCNRFQNIVTARTVDFITMIETPSHLPLVRYIARQYCILDKAIASLLNMHEASYTSWTWVAGGGGGVHVHMHPLFRTKYN
jgi:hypothetical protein